MKKFLFAILVLLISAMFFIGCAAQASSSATAPTPTPSVSDVPAAPVDTAPAETSPSPDEDKDNAANVKTYKEWAYYLDQKDDAVKDYNEDPPLHMKKTDGSGDQKLDIRGFNFDIIGDYIYVDSLDPDIDTNGIRTWSTTRMNPDGSGKKKLEYGSMSTRKVDETAQKFLFTTAGDSAIYVSDYACENIATLIIDLPDSKELDRKLDKDKALHLDIMGVKDGNIDFNVTFSSGDGIELYNGSYRISEDGKTIKKLNGTYIDNSQESETD